MPTRVRYRRGMRMPQNTIYVARPSKWGNPYEVKLFGRDVAVRLFNDTLHGTWRNYEYLDSLADYAYTLHSSFFSRFIRTHPLDAARAELKGRDLACWCELHEACHADVLLKVANS